MTLITEWILPIRTTPESNSREHWTKQQKRHKIQKIVVQWQFKFHKEPIPLPCIIKLTRIAPRPLDKAENLPMSFKWITDAIADCLIPGLAPGRADSDPRLNFQFDQEKGNPKEYAIKVQFYENGQNTG